MSRPLAAVLVAAAVAIPAPAAAEHLVWHDEWRRVTVLEGGLTAGLLVAAGLLLFVPPPEEARWSGGVLADDLARDWLRAETKDGRETAALLSDLLVLSTVAHTLLVDATLLAGAAHDSGGVAGQLFLMDIEAYAVTGFVNGVSKLLTARGRPYLAECARDPKYDDMCSSADSMRSFYSGHTSFAFTSAGLVCAHQEHLELYGSRGAGIAACAGAIAVATTAGLMRIVADKHYLSDVLVGFFVGLGAGYALPTFLHYRQHKIAPDPAGLRASSAQPVIFSIGGRL